ncbi:BrnA antitoxin family protein [Mannheimia pernigra]|nr:BrnA antitoxin family protein [Mannheimia pernigra]
MTIRYSSNVIEAFKATGKGWQSRMNKVLEDYIAQH